MECQVFELIAETGPTTLQHALVGIGCLLAYDAISRWRYSKKPALVVVTSEETSDWAEDDYRQAA